ncbi:MAG: hypothetical protein AAF283_04545 [Cyanobacteria bacterium P01_A01_bin.70]
MRTVETENDVAAAATPATPTAAAKVAPPPSELCAQVEPGNLDYPVAITNLQFHRPSLIPFEFDAMDDDDKPTEHLIGCLTNQTEQEITGVQLGLTFDSQDGSGFAMAMIDFPGKVIAPGQTVPFKHRSELYPDMIQLTLSEVITLEPMPGFEDTAFQPLDQLQPDITIAYVPAKARSGESMEGFCEKGDRPSSEALIAVSNLQIYDLPKDTYDFREQPVSILVGCITNLSADPLENLGVSYGGQYADFGAATIELPVDAIQPGETVPFRKYGELSAGTTALYVQSIGDLEITSIVTRQGISE